VPPAQLATTRARRVQEDFQAFYDQDPSYAVGAENLIRAGQVAWWYSWRMPLSRSRRRMMR
jgi:hypothetical protein